MRNKVWIVTEGELGQGGSVRGVFGDAMKAASFVETAFPLYIYHDRPQPHDFECFTYYNGSDWIKIASYRIQ